MTDRGPSEDLGLERGRCALEPGAPWLVPWRDRVPSAQRPAQSGPCCPQQVALGSLAVLALSPGSFYFGFLPAYRAPVWLPGFTSLPQVDSPPVCVFVYLYLGERKY